MKGNNWNRGASIPVSDLNESELKEAIHEWAEGCDSLEELLWLCHNNGLETNGCDAGNHHYAYIDFLLNDGSEKLLKVLSAAWEYGKVNFYCQFSGNPRSGPNWNKTVINISPRKNADAIPLFDKLCSILKGEKPVTESELCNAFLKVVKFLDKKKPDVGIHLNRKSESLYHFYFKTFKNSRNVELYSELLCKVGYAEVRNPNKPIVSWEVETSDEKELVEILEATLRLGDNF